MIIVGDLHTKWRSFLDDVERANIRDANFIQVGDFGLGLQSHDAALAGLANINHFMQARNCHIYIVRGNHDNLYYWINREAHSFPHITLVRDYEKLTIEGQQVLFVGGGISVSRLRQKPGIDYWPDEVIDFDIPMLEKACIGGVDMMISHVAPKEAWPTELDLNALGFVYEEAKAGNNLEQELEIERSQMSTIFRYVKEAGCRVWYYGHYHRDVQTTLEDGSSFFQCVGIASMYDTVRQDLILPETVTA